MRIFWLYGGLHIEGESSEEWETLRMLRKSLEALGRTPIKSGPKTAPSVFDVEDLDYQKPVTVCNQVVLS
jgi:hypothetical protein